MRHEDSWRPQDQITVSVIALGYSVWDLHYNREAESFRLELNGPKGECPWRADAAA